MRMIISSTPYLLLGCVVKIQVRHWTFEEALLNHEEQCNLRPRCYVAGVLEKRRAKPSDSATVRL